MRITFVSLTSFYGGGEVFLNRIQDSLKHKHDISLLMRYSIPSHGCRNYTFNTFFFLDILLIFLRIILTPPLRNSRIFLNGEREVIFALFLLPFVRTRISIIHTDPALYLSPQPFFTKRFFKSYLFRLSLANSTSIIAVSNYVSNLLSAQFPTKNVTTMPIPTPSNFKRHALRNYCAKNRLLDRRFTILFCSRLSTDKGLHIFLQVAQSLPDHDFLVAGYLHDKSILESFQGIDNINYLGFLEEEPLSHIYSAADFLLFPSYHEGGRPLVIQEAIYYGVTPIASNLPATHEMLPNSFISHSYESSSYLSLLKAFIAEYGSASHRAAFEDAISLTYVSPEALLNVFA